jgi:hypothetical protein
MSALSIEIALLIDALQLLKIFSESLIYLETKLFLTKGFFKLS